ncbi:MAG: hypothetical protein KA745_03745 [Gemmatimonadales bacterium]|nr:hypothetical protein [Gemmatimonadales bacterium]
MRQNEALQWQARLVRIGQAQARYVAAMFTLTLFFVGLLATDPKPGGRNTVPLLGLELPLPLLFAIGPAAIFATIIAAFGTMRMATLGKERLRSLNRYVPSAFMDVPDFVGALVFVLPARARPWERYLAILSYAIVFVVPWVTAAAILFVASTRGYVRGWIMGLWLIGSGLFAAWAFRCVTRIAVARVKDALTMRRRYQVASIIARRRACERAAQSSS